MWCLGTSGKKCFHILVDTLLGRYLPAYTHRPKQRVTQSPKFYFSNVGVVNLLAKRGRMQPGSDLFAKAFKNCVFHELNAYSHYAETFYDLSYWRLASGIEVDFIVGAMRAAIEAKAAARVNSEHMRGLSELATEHQQLKKHVLVCLEDRPRRTEDGIGVLPASKCVDLLWGGQ